jgi:hypothetical protein
MDTPSNVFFSNLVLLYQLINQYRSWNSVIRIVRDIPAFCCHKNFVSLYLVTIKCSKIAL